MSSNSLYSMPVGGSESSIALAVSGGSGSTYQLMAYTKNVKTSWAWNDGWTDSLKNRVIRFSSITVASNSPFKVVVRNAAGGTTVYQIPGQKPTKITLGVNTVAGNASMLYQFGVNERTGNLINFEDTESNVDFQLNAVMDSGSDSFKSAV